MASNSFPKEPSLSPNVCTAYSFLEKERHQDKLVFSKYALLADDRVGP